MTRQDTLEHAAAVAKYAALQRDLETQGHQLVSNEELSALWDELSARDECWNGMTDHYLHARYGDRVHHVMGIGWFLRPEC